MNVLVSDGCKRPPPSIELYDTALCSLNESDQPTPFFYSGTKVNCELTCNSLGDHPRSLSDLP